MKLTRRRLSGAAAVAALSGLAACTAQQPAGTAASSATPTATPPPPPPKELPRGGRVVFPRYRLVGYSGAPLSPALGRLGIGSLEDRVIEIEERFKDAYAGDREVLPVLELIATVVHGVPGDDGDYNSRMDDAVIDEYHAMARKHRADLLLNIQPGRARFLDELKYYEKWLVEPDVGVALDPEWAVGPGQTPGRVFGSMTAADLDECSEYLHVLVVKHDLPEKVLVTHQLHPTIIKDPERVQDFYGVAQVRSVDGIGGPGPKNDTYQRVLANTPDFVNPGFKLFYEEDVATSGVLMTPAQVMALTPIPDYVLYE